MLGTLVLSAAAQAQNTRYVYNTDKALETADSTSYRASRFRTGTNPAGYEIKEIRLRLGNVPAGAAINVVIRTGGSQPQNEVDTFRPAATLSAQSINTFIPNTAVVLEPDTPYWVTVHDGIAADATRVGLRVTSDTGDSGEPGWSIANQGLHRTDESHAWAVTDDNLVFALWGVIPPDLGELKSASIQADGATIPFRPQGLPRRGYSEAFVRLATTRITVFANPKIPGSTVRFNRGDDTLLVDEDEIADGHQVDLWGRENVIKIKVTSRDGQNARYYGFTVWRLGSIVQEPATGRPAITGTAKIGQRLTVDIGNVSDRNGMYFAETGRLVNFQYNSIDYLWRYETPDPKTVWIRSGGRSILLGEQDVGKRLFARVCFRDDLDNPECRTSLVTGRVQGGGLSVSTANRVISGSSCDYVYPAVSCDAETAPRAIGEPITVKNAANVTVESGVSWSVQNPIKRIVSDELGNVHEVLYRFDIDSSGRLHTVTGRTYPFLEAPTCRRASYDEACASGSIRGWTIDAVQVPVTARMGTSFGTSIVPVYVTTHPSAVRVTYSGDLRCASTRCYGRKLVPGQTLYKDGGNEPRSIGGPPPRPGKQGVLTAAFSAAPEEHNAKAFTVEMKFSDAVFTGNENFNINQKVREALEITNATAPGAKLLEGDGGQNYDLWRIKIEPKGRGDVRIVLPAHSGACTTQTPTCTPDGAKTLQKEVRLTVPGPATLTVNDDTVEEGPEAVLEFEVALSRARSKDVRVRFRTNDGTAHAGADYTKTNGTLTFAAGETSKTVTVQVLDDAHDEDAETMKLLLFKPAGAVLLDRKAIGTITNSDPMPAAWLSRFGRTVGEQVIEAARDRLTRTPGNGTRVTVAGYSPWHDPARDVERFTREEPLPTLEDQWNGGPELASRRLTAHDLLTGSSFSFGGSPGENEPSIGIWGTGAVSGFAGREDRLVIDGEVWSAMLGADWSTRDWSAGALVAHSVGEGSYQGDNTGMVESDITGLYPYGLRKLNERVSLWGIGGYGEGRLKLTPAESAPLETDIDLAMIAGGSRGVVVAAPDGGGPEIAAITDAMAVRTTSAAIRRSNGGSLAGARSETTRIRLGLEGTWQGLTLGNGLLSPRLEAAFRRDGGDAETGTGLDIGGGLAWSNPDRGISVAVRGRTLLMHESDELRDRGMSGQVIFDPRPETDVGLTVKLSHTMGGAASGGTEALFGRDRFEGLASTDTDRELARRLEFALGYGLPVFGGGFTATPEFGFARSATDRYYRLGWKLGPARDGLFNLSVEATRRESIRDAAPEHAIGLQVTGGW